jgi:hypothetical protein
MLKLLKRQLNLQKMILQRHYLGFWVEVEDLRAF